MFIINIVKNIKNMNEPVSVVILAQLQFDMKHTSKPAALEVEQKKINVHIVTFRFRSITEGVSRHACYVYTSMLTMAS